MAMKIYFKAANNAASTVSFPEKQEAAKESPMGHVDLRLPNKVLTTATETTQSFLKIVKEL